MARRAEIEARTGRPVRGRPPSPDSATHKSRCRANVTDPDSRLLKTKDGYVQGYNAQAVATEDQFVVAAAVTNQAHDAPSFEPMITATKQNLRRAGERRRVRRVVADAGYWSDDNANMRGVEALIAPGRARQLKQIAEADNERSALLERVEAGEVDKADAAAQLAVTRARVNQLLRRRRAGVAESLTTTMIAKLDTPKGRRLYKKRAPSIEPVFAQVKHNRGIRTASRRGLAAVDSEWKLICATHNLLKLWAQRLTPAQPGPNPSTPHRARRRPPPSPNPRPASMQQPPDFKIAFARRSSRTSCSRTLSRSRSPVVVPGRPPSSMPA